MKVYQYEFDKPFREGGMGRIYIGKHVLLQEEVVIKELILKGPEAEQQFLEEAKILYRHIRHSSFPAVKDYFVYQGRHFLVMDYIRGKSMQDFIDLGRPFNEDSICWILDRILAGLAYLHRMGIVHRDIKPGNIILNLGEHRAVLVDFGIAKNKVAVPEKQEGGKLTYTRHFASPEQYRGEACTVASDIYSLGATAYYALTNVLPPEAIKLKSDRNLKPPHEIDNTIHPQLSAAVMKAMKLNPVERFKSAGEMQDILFQIRTTCVNPDWKPHGA
ncbi:MAG: serine/threonine protein kinase [Candidatus Nealsonbacteria bacterium]|nr:serine/threonine protein kinase [Candidatus Nealsonbacteria bacterium]